MLRIALIAAVLFTILPSAGFAQTAFAQQAPPTIEDRPPQTVGVAPAGTPTPPIAGVVPQQGGPLYPAAQTGLDVVADDGVSTKNVRAVPCGTAARETDGTTTCVGIPNAPERTRR